MSRPTPSASTRIPTGVVIAVLGYCGALVSITQSIALPLLPELPGRLHTTVSAVSWVATAALLTGAVANPVFGRLGDMYGKRPMMLVCLVALTVGSVVAGAATSIVLLILGRALQGIGIAAVPLGMSLAKEVLPPERTSQGVALVSATLGIGAGIGLPIAGFLLGAGGWRSIFYVSAALGLIGLAAAAAILPKTDEHSREPFDLIGAVWLSVILVAFLLPLSQVAVWGWLGPIPIVLYAAGTLAGIGWYRYEHRPPRPLVDVELMRQRPMMLVNGAGLLLGFAMFSNLYTAIVLLQTPDTVEHGFGASVVLAGWVLLPAALVMMLMSPVSAWITDNYGGRTSMVVGSAIVGIGFATRPLLIGSLFAIGLSVAIVNCGIGIGYGAMPSVIMSLVPDTETASANAIGALARASGASVGSAAVAAVLGSMTVLGVDGNALPSLAAFQITFGLSAAAAFGSSAVALRLPRATTVPAQVLSPAEP